MKKGIYSCNNCCKYCEYDVICPHGCFPFRKCKNAQRKKPKNQ